MRSLATLASARRLRVGIESGRIHWRFALARTRARRGWRCRRRVVPADSALKDAATGPRAHRHERHAAAAPRATATRDQIAPRPTRRERQNTDERVPEVLISLLPRDDFDLLEVLRGQERGVLMVVGVAANRDQGGGQGRRGERAQARTPLPRPRIAARGQRNGEKLCLS